MADDNGRVKRRVRINHHATVSKPYQHPHGPFAGKQVLLTEIDLRHGKAKGAMLVRFTMDGQTVGLDLSVPVRAAIREAGYRIPYVSGELDPPIPVRLSPRLHPGHSAQVLRVAAVFSEGGEVFEIQGERDGTHNR